MPDKLVMYQTNCFLSPFSITQLNASRKVKTAGEVQVVDQIKSPNLRAILVFLFDSRIQRTIQLSFMSCADFIARYCKNLLMN